MLYLFIFNFYSADILYGDFLRFTSGDNGSYSIEQTVTSELNILDEVVNVKSSANINLDVLILNSDQQDHGYPLDVELTIKTITISETQEDGYSFTTIKYDSSDSDSRCQF